MAFMGLGLGGSSSLLLSGDRLPRRMIFSTLTSGVFSSTNIAATCSRSLSILSSGVSATDSEIPCMITLVLRYSISCSSYLSSSNLDFTTPSTQSRTSAALCNESQIFWTSPMSTDLPRFFSTAHILCQPVFHDFHSCRKAIDGTSGVRSCFYRSFNFVQLLFKYSHLFQHVTL